MTFDELAAQAINMAIDEARPHQCEPGHADYLQSKIIQHVSTALRQAYKDGIYVFATHKPGGRLVVGCQEELYKDVAHRIDMTGRPLM